MIKYLKGIFVMMLLAFVTSVSFASNGSATDKHVFKVFLEHVDSDLSDITILPGEDESFVLDCSSRHSDYALISEFSFILNEIDLGFYYLHKKANTKPLQPAFKLTTQMKFC